MGWMDGPLFTGGTPDIAAALGTKKYKGRKQPTLAAPQFKFANPRFVPTGAISAPQKTVGGLLEGGVANVLMGAGVSPYMANRFAGRTLGFFNDATPVGNVTGADEGGRQFMSGVSRGDLKGAGLGALSFGLSVLPVPGGAKRAARKAGMFGSLMRDQSGAIRAWHGSPHDFDRFDMSKIGTGEGAQAYGHGLYFAENKKVAEGYQKELGGRGFQVAGEPLDLSRVDHVAANGLFNAGGDINLAKQQLLNQAEQLRSRAAMPQYYGSNFEASADRMRDAAIHLHKNPNIAMPEPVIGGRLYEVNIDANPEDFLDWDRPLVKQPRALEALKGINLSGLGEGNRTRRMLEMARDGTGQADLATGRELLNAVSGYGENRGMAEHNALLPYGLQGVQYLDQGSRGLADGTRNYVVFRDDLVNILNKY